MLRKITLLLALLALALASVSLLQAGQTLPLPGGRVTVELLTNGDFEIDGDTNKIPDDWIAKNTEISKSDKMKCEKTEGPIAHSGKCAFMFRGNLGGAASNIAQTLSDFSALTEGSTLEFTTYIDPRKGVPGATFGKAQVKFSDGGKLTLKLAIPEGDTRGVEDYVLVTDSAVLELGSATITNVKIKFSYNQNSGKFLIDAASLTVSDGIDETPTATLTETPTVTETPTSTPTVDADQLLSDDGSGGNNFGHAVAVSGNSAAVGAYFMNNQGAAYVFTHDAGNWTQQQKLTADDAANTDEFGSAVAIDGDTLIVGAQGRNTDQGAAYVFTRSGTVWTKQQTLTASDAANGDYFGSSAALDGNTLVIGAWGKNTFQGVAYVFTYNGSTWVEQQKLTASDAASGDQFGASVALDGDTVLIGAFAKSTHKGAAYVFTRSGDTWTEQQKLTASDAANNDFFGLGVGLDGDTAMLGAPNRTGSGGAVYVFTRSGGIWTEQPPVLVSSNAAGNEGLGQAVALSGNTAVFTADNENSGQGGAYVFTYNGSAWIEQQHLTATDGLAGDYFGITSVALDANIVLVGVPEDDVNDAGAQGSAWAFVLP